MAPPPAQRPVSSTSSLARFLAGLALGALLAFSAMTVVELLGDRVAGRGAASKVVASRTGAPGAAAAAAAFARTAVAAWTAAAGPGAAAPGAASIAAAAGAGAGASAGAGGAAAAGADARSPLSCASLERAEYGEADVRAALARSGPWPAGAGVEDVRKGGGSVSGFWHNRVDAACPRFVAAAQNFNAGIGHRLVAYSMALHTAIWFNVTFTHTSLDGGHSSHGKQVGPHSSSPVLLSAPRLTHAIPNPPGPPFRPHLPSKTSPSYDGWDAWLAFTVGEHGFDAVRARPGLRRVKLPELGGYYLGNEAIIARWKGVILDPANCNVLFDMPQDQWAFDVSATTKFVLSAKFAAAMAAHAAGRALFGGPAESPDAGPVRPPPAPALEFDPAAVSVAVHIRIGDQYPTPEWVEARVVAETIAPALRAAGVRAPLHVHVFAEKEGAARFPALAALARAPAAPAAEGAAAGAAEGAGDAAAGGGYGDGDWPAGGVEVFFHPDMAPLPSFFHLTQADFLVMSFSSFSFAAAQVALRPLALAQPSSDIFRMCADASVCCLHSGDCAPVAKLRALAAARRLRALELCGRLA